MVAYMPNIPETVAAFLACASIGAIWSSAAPEFGARSVIDRFEQIEPKVMLAVDGYRYAGRDHDRREVVREIAEQIGAELVSFGYLDGAGWPAAFRGEDAQLEFAQLPFDHPLWVLYSSGTTGLPKAIVHGQGGILLEHLKKMHLHLDAQEGDRVFWFTTTGWMMWNFLIGVLLTPAEIVLYDGSPGEPDLGVLWDLAERTGMTCFGTSAAYVASCMKGGVQPGRAATSPPCAAWAPPARRSRPRASGGSTSTWAPTPGSSPPPAAPTCAPPSWAGCPPSPSISASCRRGSLGARVEAFDEEGNALVGEVGELVITEPMPSMPIYFWNDPGGERLRESYFDMYPGVWRHGDWIEITERGTAVIYGRSDSTINRGGIRMGTSEIYRAVLDSEAVVDALVVDVPREGAENWMPLFVVLREGAVLDDALRKAWPGRCARRARPAMCPTRCSRSRRCRARSRARCWRCRSSAS